MNQTIYFRKGVWDKFQHEKEKSDLINSLLEMHYESIVEVKKIVDKVVPVGTHQYDVQPTPIASLALACCLAQKPCMHWIWDGAESQYTNSRTGEVRSVDF